MLVRPLCSRILEALLVLFPFDELTKSIEPLLEHEDQQVRPPRHRPPYDSIADNPQICRSIMKTLEVRVRSAQIDKASKIAIIGLLPHLTRILEDSDRTALKANALACIDQICEKCGKTDSAATFAAAQVIASKSCLGSDDMLLRVLSLHCLASSVEILQNDFIPLLQQATQGASICLESSLKEGSRNERLHNAAYAFFTALADHVPFMITKASLRAVVELSYKSALANLSTEADESRSQLMKLAATRVEFATVVGVLDEAWPAAVKQGPLVSFLVHCENARTNTFQALREYTELLKVTVENHSKSTVAQSARPLFNILLNTLDLRRSHVEDHLDTLYSQKDVDDTEGSVIQTFVAVVLKINDAVFRPLFVQLLDWATTSVPKRSSVAKVLRSTTLFNVTSALSERLKVSGLFQRNRSIGLIVTSRYSRCTLHTVSSVQPRFCGMVVQAMLETRSCKDLFCVLSRVLSSTIKMVSSSQLALKVQLLMRKKISGKRLRILMQSCNPSSLSSRVSPHRK